MKCETVQKNETFKQDNREDVGGWCGARKTGTVLLEQRDHHGSWDHGLLESSARLQYYVDLYVQSNSSCKFSIST